MKPGEIQLKHICYFPLDLEKFDLEPFPESIDNIAECDT